MSKDGAMMAEVSAISLPNGFTELGYRWKPVNGTWSNRSHGANLFWNTSVNADRAWGLEFSREDSQIFFMYLIDDTTLKTRMRNTQETYAYDFGDMTVFDIWWQRQGENFLVYAFDEYAFMQIDVNPFTDNPTYVRRDIYRFNGDDSLNIVPRIELFGDLFEDELDTVYSVSKISDDAFSIAINAKSYYALVNDTETLIQDLYEAAALVFVWNNTIGTRIRLDDDMSPTFVPMPTTGSGPGLDRSSGTFQIAPILSEKSSELLLIVSSSTNEELYVVAYDVAIDVCGVITSITEQQTSTYEQLNNQYETGMENPMKWLVSGDLHVVAVPFNEPSFKMFSVPTNDTTQISYNQTLVSMSLKGNTVLMFSETSEVYSLVTSEHDPLVYPTLDPTVSPSVSPTLAPSRAPTIQTEFGPGVTRGVDPVTAAPDGAFAINVYNTSGFAVGQTILITSSDSSTPDEKIEIREIQSNGFDFAGVSLRHNRSEGFMVYVSSPDPTPPPTPPPTHPPGNSQLSQAVQNGSTSIVVEYDVGFAVGDKIVIAEGTSSEETNKITDITEVEPEDARRRRNADEPDLIELELEESLQFAHDANTTVREIPDTPPLERSSDYGKTKDSRLPLALAIAVPGVVFLAVVAMISQRSVSQGYVGLGQSSTDFN